MDREKTAIDRLGKAWVSDRASKAILVYRGHQTHLSVSGPAHKRSV